MVMGAFSSLPSVNITRGSCKHGRKGLNCEYSHPDPCRKLMQHGNNGPMGCKEGNKCNSFHPRMWRTSISKRECFDVKCTLLHVKGTYPEEANGGKKPK